MKKSTQIHHRVAVKTKRLRVQGLVRKISMMQCRRYVDNLELPVSNTLPKEVKTVINVLTVGNGHKVFRQMDRPLIIFLLRGTPNIAVRESKTPETPHENRLAKTRGHRHILCLSRLKRNGFLRPRVKRYAGTSAHDNSIRDRPSVVGLVRIVRVHVQVKLDSITQTPMKSNTISTRRRHVHHDVQRCLPINAIPLALQSTLPPLEPR